MGPAPGGWTLGLCPYFCLALQSWPGPSDGEAEGKTGLRLHP